jgi:hypothetical protein
MQRPRRFGFIPARVLTVFGGRLVGDGSLIFGSVAVRRLPISVAFVGVAFVGSAGQISRPPDGGPHRTDADDRGVDVRRERGRPVLLEPEL